VSKPTIIDMERVLKRHFPEIDDFPLLRTLSFVAWELDVSRRDLLKSLKNPRKVLWYRRGKVFVPPDVYTKWKNGV
jgi:hypothetical protein